MSSYFFNLSIKKKFIIIILLMTSLVSVTLGYYSYTTSKSQIIDNVSTSSLSVTQVVNSNLSSMQKSISDWVTVFILSSVVQKSLQQRLSESDLESALYSGPTASIMDQMLITGSTDYIALYGTANDPLYQVAKDGSSGAGTFDRIRGSAIYEETSRRNGAAYWYPLSDENNLFIEYNTKEKIGMSRIIRSTLNGEKLGFIFVGVNHQTIRNQYLRNLYDEDHGIMVLDQSGTPLISAGMDFYSADLLAMTKNGRQSDSVITTSKGEELLLTYSKTDSGWIILYAVPIGLLTKQLDSIKLFVILVILACILLSLPLSMTLSHILSAPVKKLLISMRRFQNGHFEERVEVKYQDEIGLLGQGYNRMVASIKTLVDEAYVLQLKERQAELKALQSQINPHFLYNMLDMIFWEAERAGQEHISEMVITLSRLFRLSLNQGKSFTSIGKEKEFIQLYLQLQQMRFNDKLTYRIDIPEELDHYVLLKLCLQPFIENALIHGIERKREGGYVHIDGWLADGYVHFTVTDNGIGMSDETLQEITKLKQETDVYTSHETGGYAIQNIIQRLRHYYNDQYNLTYTSQPGQGTKVELKIPIMTENQEAAYDPLNDR
ncbi:two-component system sensor histidine kinase YesM [Paenibacillus phyllosphaerae]|uniref:Two-component system sensor histidine kinase YesM n=1 Tax=Paenibacillus phyllosphaerae TaxID=274593 RepID=A0A7W5B0X8_9BACL|nr:sensor histidine kinase [Paenibacillus phyllosphaerae]MBB3112372.1 two-component system sensor histidine kinase YesM [Paenibacillus phyllosphaerae]